MKLNRNSGLDICKLTLAILVVLIHSQFLLDISPIISFITVNGLFRIAVPLFLLINGYYFFDILHSKKVKRWSLRLSILYLIWMAFYSVLWLDLATPLSVYESLLTLIFGYGHLWYLSGALGAGFLLFLFQRFPFGIRFSITGLLFLIGVMLQYSSLFNLLKIPEIPFLTEYWFYRNWFFFAFPFFSLGYMIREKSLEYLYSLKTLVIAAIVSVILLLFESFALSQSLSNEDVSRGQAGVDILLTLFSGAPVIFLMMFKIGEVFKVSFNTKTLAVYSSAVYFTHIMVLNLIRQSTDMSATLLSVVVVLISFTVSALLLRLNKYWPYLL